MALTAAIGLAHALMCERLVHPVDRRSMTSVGIVPVNRIAASLQGLRRPNWASNTAGA